ASHFVLLLLGPHPESESAQSSARTVIFSFTWASAAKSSPESPKASGVANGKRLKSPPLASAPRIAATFAVRRRRCDYGGSEGKTAIEAAPLPITATIALEMIGPIPGTVINHWQLSSARAKLVCRQSISDSWLGNLRECLAHLV